MRHLKNVRKFNKDREHRKAMFSNMMTSFFANERITTTLAKAKELKRLSEKAITRAKVNSLHNKRMVMRRIRDRDIIAKLFDKIAPKYKEVNGGYTRILKLGTRAGDGADLARIELVDHDESAAKKKSRGAAKQAAPKRAPAKDAQVEQAVKQPAKTKAKAGAKAEAKAPRKTAVKKQADKKSPAKKSRVEGAGEGQPAGSASPAEQVTPDGPGAPAGQASPGGENPSATQT
jgi:large subunit ribosomal protein L17